MKSLSTKIVNRTPLLNLCDKVKARLLATHRNEALVLVKSELVIDLAKRDAISDNSSDYALFI